MRNGRTVKWTILTMATAGLVGIAAVLACAPAAPTPSAENAASHATKPPNKEAATATPTPTLTPTPEGMDCYTHYDPRGKRMESCRPLVPPVVDPNLQHAVDQHMAEKEKAKGARATVEPKFLLVTILTDSADAVDPLVEYLEENTTGRVRWSKEPGPGSMGASAYVNLEQIPTIAAMDGVIRIYETPTTDPAGVNPQGGTPTPLTAQQAMQVEHWHNAGIKGKGVQVGIIDHDFRNFGGQILTRVTKPVRWLCWDANDMAAEGITSTPSPDFARCQRIHQPPLQTPHGTAVSAALLDIAPDAELLISNANTPPQIEEAVNWLTAKRSDNFNTRADYNVRNNDLFDVRVINHSGTSEWDGPGDGTSPHHSGMMVSNLNVLDDAVTNGAAWTNAAGNGARRTWFKRTTDDDFNSSNQLKMDPSTPTDPCNYVTLNTNDNYPMQARWSGQWEGQRNNADLNLDLYGPYPLVPDPSLPAAARVAYSDNQQNGGNSDYPTEKFTVGPGEMFTVPANGRYCLLVTKAAGETTPAWIQLQSRNSGTTLSATSNEGHIETPAESANQGMLAVGASNNAATPTIQDFSARGPAPEPHPSGRIKPDITGVNTNLSGTSYSSPRVAGIAALTLDILNNPPRFATPRTPEELANSLKEGARLTGQPNNTWGHGMARVGILGPLENVQIQHVPCTDARQSRVTFDNTIPAMVAGSGNVTFHEVSLVPVSGGDAIERRDYNPVISGDEGYFAFQSVPDSVRYQATTQTCILDNQGKTICGEVGVPSRPAFIPAEICIPNAPSVIGGHDYVTLRWNHDRHATKYQVEIDDVVQPGYVRKNYVVVTGLTLDDNERTFRVRATGPPGTSPWSAKASGEIQRNAAPETPRVLQHHTGRGIESTNFGIQNSGLTALYQIKMWNATARKFELLPFQEAGRSEKYTLDVIHGVRGANFVVGNLEPAQRYYFQARGINGRIKSQWSNTFYSDVLPPPGVDPTTLPPPATPPPPRMPSTNLTASVSGTNVNLTWTATTNPNYVDQMVIRRVAGESPENWTEFKVEIGDTTYTDTTATAGTKYIYRVRVVKANGVDDISNRAEITIPAPPKMPPTNLTATMSGTTVNLTWTAHTNPNYGSQLVRRRVAGERPENWTEFTLGLNDTSYTDTTAVSGTRYIYRIRAVKENGTPGDSNAHTVAIP